MDKINEHVDKLCKINQNVFFTKLKDIPTTESFVDSMKGVYSLVDFHSILLGHLISKVPSIIERPALIKILNRESGYGNLKNSHLHVFEQFLTSFGDTVKQLVLYDDNDPSYCIVKDCIGDLYESSLNHTWIYALSMLGMIFHVMSQVNKNINLFSETFTHKSYVNFCETYSQELFSLFLEHIEDQGIEQEIGAGLKQGYQIIDTMFTELSHILKPNDFSFSNGDQWVHIIKNN
jgi:hypothetical protein